MAAILSLRGSAWPGIRRPVAGCSSAEVEFCSSDLAGDRLEVEIAPVRKDDDGHPVRREALDDRPEAHRLAVVPGALASLPRARNQPKP